MMNSNYLLPYILQPTHVTDRSATLTDNIFANTFNFNALSGNLVTKISDHFPQFIIIEDLKVNYATLNWSYKHDYSPFSEEAFVDKVSHLDFPPIYNSNLNTNGKFDLFCDQIDSVCKVHVRYKRLSKKEVEISSKPWTTKEIFAKIKFRDNPVDNPKDIVNIFNNFFANVGKTTDKGIPRGSHSPSFYLRGNYSGSIFFIPCQFFYSLKSGLSLVKWMLVSLLAHTVYLLPF